MIHFCVAVFLGYCGLIGLSFDEPCPDITIALGWLLLVFAYYLTPENEN